MVKGGMTEHEAFWENESFLVVTDKTKPAMKWTIKELEKRGKRVYVLDLSDRPDGGSLTQFSDLSTNIDCAVIGLTRSDPANAIQELKRIGIKNIWIHWRTETQGARRECQEEDMHCITGRCPMMYLAGPGLSIHSMHRMVAKMLGKY